MTRTRLPSGFRAAGIHGGIKKDGTPDFALLVAEKARPAAAVFTTNRLLGAHIPVCREHLETGGSLVRAILVNSGNANCATGAEGIADARSLAQRCAALLECPTEQVLPLSTGVIGARLPHEAMLRALPELVAACRADGAEDFARAVMTTDTVPKLATSEGVLGVAKGSGMIHPDMATMLAFLLADDVGPDPKALLHRLNERSFQRLSVDGDTSPNDTAILWGRQGDAPRAKGLLACAQQLARAIARDGEGAGRLVTVQVEGAPDETSATVVGRCIATSMLCKTAVHGGDPNWGRILSAAGRAGVPFDAQQARVWVGPATVYRAGQPLPEAEPAAAEHLRQEDPCILGIDLQTGGSGQAEVWTCDLSAEYVRINADYRS